jgi:hypothetical protein
MEPDKNDVNQLLEAAKVPGLVLAAAIALAGSSVMVGLVGLQNVLLVSWRGAYAALPYTLLALAAFGLVVASKQHRGRAWSLSAGLALAIVLTVAMLGSAGLSLASGVFSLLGMLAVPCTIAAIVIQAIALRPFAELVATRRRLRQSGFDLDF